MEISREELLLFYFPFSVSPGWNPARVLTCSGKQDLWWPHSCRQQPPVGWEQWREAGHGLWEGKVTTGTKLLMPSDVVSLWFHHCCAGTVSLTTLAVFHSGCYEFALSPWLFQEPFWSFLECWVSLSLSIPLIFCLHMPFTNPLPNPNSLIDD